MHESEVQGTSSHEEKLLKEASLENILLAPALRAADENSTSSKMAGRVKKVTGISTHRYQLYYSLL